jgi:hypothetical protein
MKLRTYLRIINPIVSVLVLIICLWAGMVDEGDFKPAGVIKGSISTYFLAKGLFCSSALFVLGKILEMMLTKPDTHVNESQVED